MALLFSIKMANVLEVNQFQNNGIFLQFALLIRLESSEAAKKAITQVVLSRIGMAVPGMIIPPIIMNSLEQKPFMRRRPWLNSPLQIVLCGFFLTFTTPMCCALFPQKSSLTVAKLDAKLREKLLRDGMKDTDQVYFNKGL